MASIVDSNNNISTLIREALNFSLNIYSTTLGPKILTGIKN